MAIEAVYTGRSGTAPCGAEDGPGKHEQHTLPVPTAPSFRRQGGPAIEDALSPPREGRRDDDATKMSVPILIFIAMLVSSVTAAISASGVYWMLRLTSQEAQLQMQADIRSIREGLASKAREDAADQRATAAEIKLQMQSFDSTKEAVNTMRGIVQLMQLQMAELIKQRRP